MSGISINVKTGDTKEIVTQPAQIPVAQRRKQAKSDIDVEAGIARASFTSVGDLLDQEYKQTIESLKDWRSGGSNPASVPNEVQSWADAKGWTVEQAAADIEATSQAWHDVIANIRAIRLVGKSAVDAAHEKDIYSTAQTYIDQLRQIRP